jgi:hypothetical protein
MSAMALFAVLIVAPPGHPPFLEIPKREFVLTFRQIGRMREGRVTIQVAVQNPTDHEIRTSESLAVPWGCDGHTFFHYAVFVGSKGQALPNEQFVAFCYDRPLTIPPGDVHFSRISLDAEDVPAFKNANPEKDVIEFVWVSRVPGWGGGVVAIE